MQKKMNMIGCLSSYVSYAYTSYWLCGSLDIFYVEKTSAAINDVKT